MSFFDLLISVVVPHDCLACGAEGRLLCRSCLAALPGVPPRCQRCYGPSTDWLTCTACRPHSRLDRVCAATVYDGSAKALVWKLKLAGARAAAGIMAGQMMPLIRRAGSGTVIVPVPTATGRVRQRGYDQARLLARELGRRTGLPCHNYLVRHGQTHQHGLTRQERLSQLAGTLRVIKPHLVQGTAIVLVDDVITTGATLEAAAAVLRAAGAAQIDAITFACAEPNLAERGRFELPRGLAPP